MRSAADLPHFDPNLFWKFSPDARRERGVQDAYEPGSTFKLVTAAAGHIPPPLLQQLKPGGRMVIPVGPPFGSQHLTVVERDPEGRVRTRQLFPVRFVPLTGQH